MQRLALVLLGTTVAMTLSACGGGSSGGDQGSPPITIPTRPPTHTATPSSPTPTPTSTPTSTPTPTPTPTHTVTETAKPGPQACQSGALSLSLGQSQGAAGSTYVPVVLTNTGAKTCTLRGYPGVSFVDASGTLLGKPARQATGSPPKTLKLGSGEAA
ncbi:MAG: DUF4232 domain-containing protein, partial [Frankiaceae bacterium]|nr:DUF4232 domain-containing protein [Frankiaceae bacterium]